MIAIATAERAVTVRPLAPEFFDALEASVHQYALHIRPALVVVRDTEGDPRIEPRAIVGHLMMFSAKVYESEPDLAQSWLDMAVRTLERLNLTPQLVAEAIVHFNMQRQRLPDTPLSWAEACLALNLTREDA